MVGHSHKRAEVDVPMLHCECKRLDYYLALAGVSTGFLA